ncbi:glycosyltransferase [Candidatus Parcubacteria bacterium]|nr:glycosyltransferase [Candidatus Parcubacteria bacterium]
MNKPPLATMFFLAYNCGKYLEDTIQPILHQTYPNVDVIISDNQSTDNTAEVAKALEKKYPRVMYRKNVTDIKTDEFTDIGAKSAGKKYDICLNHCNGCLRSGMATGEFVMFCHQDDVYEKNIIEKQVGFLLEHPEAAAVFTMGNIIGKNGEKIGENKLPGGLRNKQIFHFAEVFQAILNHGNMFLLTPTFMARTSTFEKLGLFDDHGPFGGSDDLEMWLRILEHAPVGILQENLINRRVGGRAKKYNTLRTEKADFFKLMDYYLDEKGYAKSMDEKSLRQYAYQKDFDNTLRGMNFLIQGDIGAAKKIISNPFPSNYLRAFIENPTRMRIKVLALKCILWTGINLGPGKILGGILHKVFIK